MKIISIKQPWAHLIVTGFKNVENRTWSTRYRGWALVHSSQRPDGISADQIEQRYGVRPPSDLPRGGIVGMTEILDCVRPHPSKWYAEGVCIRPRERSRVAVHSLEGRALASRSAPRVARSARTVAQLNTSRYKT
jgi:ASCH domain